MKKVNYIVSLLWIIIFCCSAALTAQEPLVSATWHVQPTEGHYDTRPKVSSEFRLSPSAIIKTDTVIDPWCRCGTTGFQYFVFQHRLRNSSDEWANGKPYTKDIKGPVSDPESPVDGKRLEWTSEIEVLPGAEKFVYRILLFPNRFWTGSGHYTPEQILAISLTSISQKKAGGGRIDAKACGYALSSGIYDKWIQKGGEAGFLACARSDEAEAARSPFGTSGRYVLFRGWSDAGMIIWHGNGRFAGRAFEVHGAIGQLYQSLGGTKAWLGFPTSDEYSVTGGRRSDFEGGYIFWDENTFRTQAFKYPPER